MRICKLLIVVLLFCGLMGCAARSEPVTETTTYRLRVLTYNIHHGEGTDGKFDYERLAAIIKGVNPDLVALQEVDRATSRSKGVDQAAKLGELTGMHHYFAEAMPYQGGGYGEAVLSRFAIDRATDCDLSAASGQEPRSAAVIEVKPWGDEGPRIVFSGVHLCHQSEETRVNQIGELNGRDLFTHLPSILAGDFNFTPDSEPYKQTTGQYGWTDMALVFGDPKPTIPSDNPSRRIDYVFVRPASAWKVVEVQVLNEPVASDHVPVLVVLEYTPAQP